MTELCVCCGAEIPEGRQTCPQCEYQTEVMRYDQLGMVDSGRDGRGGDRDRAGMHLQRRQRTMIRRCKR